ncbi:unnamed protein product [Mytilus edulis]|uniref:Uncharacterized protein n=1 Tax=Mytilus edulis TaxID=6550 RepID=A0A8S3U9C4_MYTED|nr:unnamed protein product [Mytilus edulis]
MRTTKLPDTETNRSVKPLFKNDIRESSCLHTPVFRVISVVRVATLQSNTQILLEKVNQLETESNVKVCNIESCSAPIQRIKRNEERIIDASYNISDILLLVGSIRNDFESNKTKMHEVLSKEKSDLDIVVKKIEIVIREQNNVRTMKEEMNTVKMSIEQCLTLKDDLKCNDERLRNVNKQMEKFNLDSSFLQQEINRLSQNIHVNYKEVIKLKTLLKSMLLIMMHTTELIRLDNLLGAVQQVEIKKIEVKLDKTEQSVSSLLKEIKTHSEEITKIPDRLHTLNKTTEILSIDIGDKWFLVQKITVVFVLVVFTICGGLLYSRRTQIGDIEKKYASLQKTRINHPCSMNIINILKLNFQESLRNVKQIKRRRPEELENKFCVVSFSPETHNKHRRITRPSVEGRLRIKKMDEADFVVTNDKSVMKIPHCKVILVFVDHNQKDVILETPGEDEEDIKLLTVKTCRKMGADVFVIYVGDEDHNR